MSQEGIAVATSLVSQEEADRLAIEEADLIANHKLKCAVQPIGASQIGRHTYRPT